MKRSSLRNAAVVVITLGALTAVGTMVASASTRPAGATTAPGAAGNQAGQQGGQTAGPFDPTATPSSPDPTGAADSSNACVAVQIIAAQNGAQQNGNQQNTGAQQNADAQLCTTVELTGQRIDQVRVTLTVPAGDCRDGATLGFTTGQAGDAVTQFAACADTTRATAAFTPDRQVTGGSQVCGTIAADDRFAAAQACVRAAA